jgi:hypothetical protein
MPPPPRQRHQDFVGDGVFSPRQIRRRDRIAVHIDAGNIVRPGQARIAVSSLAVMQQRLRHAAVGNSGRGRSRSGQKSKDQQTGQIEILLRLLHRNTSRYFVTGRPNHSIYKGIKELAKAGRRQERPSSGKNIAARRAKAGASSGLSLLEQRSFCWSRGRTENRNNTFPAALLKLQPAKADREIENQP